MVFSRGWLGKHRDMSLDAYDVALPTYALLARFRLAPSAATAELREQLTAAELPFHEVTVERSEPDGSTMVLVRFVGASVDAHTAAAGLYETLESAGLDVDEVWVDSEVA